MVSKIHHLPPLTSAKLASAGAVFKASNFQWNNLGGRKELAMMILDRIMEKASGYRICQI